jgi:hypothetical protein
LDRAFRVVAKSGQEGLGVLICGRRGGSRKYRLCWVRRRVCRGGRSARGGGDFLIKPGEMSLDEGALPLQFG